MIERLDQLTMSRFIDLVCGDTGALTSKGEAADPAILSATARNIIFEYHSIVDEAGTKRYLLRLEDLLKGRIGIAALTICENLAALREYGRVREVLKEQGINTGGMSDKRVAAEVKSRLCRARRDVEKLEEESKPGGDDSGDPRSAFDALTAQLMAHFKFQIGIDSIKATVYAHLVARHNREINAQLAAMAKR